MKSNSTTLGNMMLVLREKLHRYNVDWRELFDEAGIKQDLKPSDRIPSKNMLEFTRLLKQKTKIQCLGLDLSEHVKLAGFHAVGMSILVSNTLLEALNKFVRFHRMLVNDAFRITTEESSSEVKFKVELLLDEDNQFILDEEGIDFLLAIILRISRELLGPEIYPLSVKFQRKEREYQRYVHVFGPSVEFSANENSITFDKAILDTPLPTRNVELALHNEQIIKNYLATLEDEDLLSAVYSKIVELLQYNTPTLKSVAEALDMDARTLQYQLGKKDTSFKKILDETRKELALSYIQDLNLSISEICFLLGFSSPSNFNRTFMRWTNYSPTDYRKLH